MPDITITPGTFNPPGTLAVVHGALDFPKTPVQQVKRPALQYNSRWVEVDDVTVAPNIEFTLWNPYYFAAAGPRSVSAATFTVTGARYVPDGTYPDDLGTGDFYGDYLDAPPPLGEYVNVSDTGGFYVPGAQATGFLSYTYPIQITLVGCTDGATYEVQGLWPGMEDYVILTNAGGGIWTAVATHTVGVPSTAEGEGVPVSDPVELSQFGEFRLFRNGELYDAVYLDAGCITEMSFAGVGTWVPEDHETVEGPALQAINLALYGPNATALQTVASSVIPASAGIVQWNRTSYALQGNLTPNP